MWAVLLTAAVFYALLPLVGAYRARRRWAGFRRAVASASALPELDFARLHSPGTSAEGFRLTGRLEAFEGDNRLWIGNGRLSVPVSLQGTVVYFLDEPTGSQSFGFEPPRAAGASELGALPEGTRFLAAGPLTADPQGQAVFETRPGSGLLVLAFESDPDTVLARAVYTGRPAVDHWNAWTPLALGAGVLLLLVLAYVGLATGDRRTGLAALALALLPATFFLPPGILFFYWFLRLWTRGRECRAWADLTRGGGDSPTQPDLWDRRGQAWELAAQTALGLGMLANGTVLVFLLRLWVP